MLLYSLVLSREGVNSHGGQKPGLCRVLATVPGQREDELMLWH